MTLATNQDAAAREATPELYRFSCGATVTCYTSYALGKWFLGDYYEPRPITHSGFTETEAFDPVTLKVTAPADGELLKYVANTPIEPTRIKIYRALLSNINDYELLFSGVMLQPSFAKNTISMPFESMAHIFKRRYLRYVYQSWCNHEVFDSGCALVRSAWRIAGTVSGISGASITVAECAALGDGYFTGGYVECGTDARMITQHVGSTLGLHMAFDSRVAVGTAVGVYPGCPGDPDICLERFDNRAHFFGMQYISAHNPVIWGFK